MKTMQPSKLTIQKMESGTKCLLPHSMSALIVFAEMAFTFELQLAGQPSSQTERVMPVENPDRMPRRRHCP
jgi:hypothetical protein